MSKEKHRHRKKHHNDATNESQDNSLFTEADAKSVEVSGYTVGHGAPQNSQLMQGNALPTGVVDIDESVQLPISPTKSRHQHHDPKPFTIIRPSENYRKEHAHLPPISHHYQHHPSPDYDHSGHLSYPYPVYHEHHSPHHHHHHHHHRHHHHKYEKEVETYDPRWWYLPINSVHRPKPWQPPEHHYIPPKWYEPTSRQSGILMSTPESKSSPRKYVDCRCEVCKPSKERPRGIKWVVSE